MRKLKPLLLVPAFCLASCSKGTYAGTYSFQLGKAGSTNIRFAMTLTDEPVIVEAKGINAKKFTIDANIPNLSLSEFLTDFDEDEYGITEEELSGFVTSAINDIKDDIVLYYNVGTLEKTYGKQLKIGALIDVSEYGIQIPNELIEHVVCAYINDKTVTLQIPVSEVDLQHQLCWYGLFFNPNATTSENILINLDQNKLPGVKGEERYGTHPEIEKDEKGNIVHSEVDDMNITFAKEFSNTPVYADNTCAKVIGYMSKNPDGNMYFYRNSDTVITSANVLATLKLKNSYGVYDVVKDVLLTIDTSAALEQDSYKLIELRETAGEAPIVEETKYYQQPFTFRNFHDIKMGLAKEQ